MAQQLPVDFEFRANQTFNDFFPGTHCEIVAHLQQCIGEQGELQVFIWGQSGQGKTHLLQACCHQAQQQNFSSFYFDLAQANLPDPTLLSGLDQYDVVCFDNIECLASNADWERAFFIFFNRQRDLGHKLILSACSAPHELAIQLPDLKTRLNWGLTLKIQQLTDSDKIAALIFKAKKMGFEIAPQAGRFLLMHYARDLASLWALLEKLDKASLAAKRKLTVPFLKQILDQEGE